MKDHRGLIHFCALAGKRRNMLGTGLAALALAGRKSPLSGTLALRSMDRTSQRLM